jgi:hypothetical protein
MPAPCRNEAVTAPNLAAEGTFAMTTFDKREEAFEKKFALDEEQKFKAVARRNRLLGLWAAKHLGLSDDATSTYAREVVAAEFSEGGDAAVVRKVMGDLAAKGVAITEAQIGLKMDELMALAIAQVKAGK